MSYRKPVPLYIPTFSSTSPPSPPATQSDSDFVAPLKQTNPVAAKVWQRNLGPRESFTPDLPSDWREVIAEAESTDGIHEQGERRAQSTATPRSDERSLSVRPGDPTNRQQPSSECSPKSGKRLKRKSYQCYRPPTPPLPSRRRLPSGVPMSPHTRNLSGKQYPSPLRRNLSFGTERTLVSYSTSAPSATIRTVSWHSDRNSVDDNILPIHLCHPRVQGTNGRETEGHDDSGESTVTTMWNRRGFWISVKTKLRKVWGSMI